MTDDAPKHRRPRVPLDKEGALRVSVGIQAEHFKRGVVITQDKRSDGESYTRLVPFPDDLEPTEVEQILAYAVKFGMTKEEAESDLDD